MIDKDTNNKIVGAEDARNFAVQVQNQNRMH